MRVVLDTNVLVAGFRCRGGASRVWLRAARADIPAALEILDSLGTAEEPAPGDRLSEEDGVMLAKPKGK